MTTPRRPPAQRDPGADRAARRRLEEVRQGLRRWQRDRHSGEAVARLIFGLDRAEEESESLRQAPPRRAVLQRHQVRIAEAAVGLRLLEQGAAIDSEVPGPRGRACDLLARRGGLEIAIHIKRLEVAGVDAAPPRGLASRERGLERLQRPLLVGVRWRGDLPPESAAELVGGVRAFLLHARVGDEQTWRDPQGFPLGEVRVLGTHGGSTVRLVHDQDRGFDLRVERIRRSMRKAYGQFLPGRPNLVLFAAAVRGLELELERALLGSPVERWDLHPARGERVAHGRGADGFWQAQRFAASELAGWFDPASRAWSGRWWSRPGRVVPADLAEFLIDVVGPHAAPAAIEA